MFHCPRRLCGVALAVIVTLGMVAIAARAQTPPNTASPAPAASAAEMRQLVTTLQDPVARGRLIAVLQALIAAGPSAAAAAPAPAAATVTANPAMFFDALSQQVDAVIGEILEASRVVVDAPRLMRWAKAQTADEQARDFWRAVAVRLAIIFGVGLLADRATRLMIAGPARRLVSAPGATLGTQIFLMVLAILIEALPAVAFAVAASFALPFTHPHFGTRQVARVLIGAILWTRIVLAAVRVALLSASAARLYPLGEETRQYLYIWARRFTGWAVYGSALASAAWWLGVPGAIYALLLRTTILVLAILAIVFVLQNRRTVAEWMHGGSPGLGGWRIIRHRLADTWHVLAIIYIVGTFGVFVLDVRGGFLFLLRATLMTIVVLLAAVLIVRGFEQVNRRGFAISPDLKRRYPTLESRANRYLPVLYVVTATIVYAFAALAILQAWGIDAFAWLDTETGRRVAGSCITIAIVLVVTLMIWEFFSSAIERYLNGTSGDGSRIARSARVRTLLPLLRTTMLVLVVAMVGLIVLSQIGVNIAPLLAGAGVVGLAVGFGSQTLVKDFITGLFILVEDTLSVGDMVDVGKGMGLVEAISIRTIRLRDVSGTLQTIPFSDVTTIKNMARGYAFSVHDIGILYHEDPDRAVAVLQEAAAEMAADPAWAPAMLAPLEIIGLDRFTDAGQIIRVRLKTVPMQQWRVQREFNRRLKQAFDRHGIEMPTANQMHYLEPPAKT
jgi:small conductance mechanosensitive channel